MPRGGKRPGSGRKPGWKHSETTVIRVPKVFSSQLLDIARQLDDGESFGSITKPEAQSRKGKKPGKSSATVQLSIGSETKSKADENSAPMESDGDRWLTSREAYQVAQQRGCLRSFEGFRKWSRRSPDDCAQEFQLRRLDNQSKRNNAPSYEDIVGAR